MLSFLAAVLMQSAAAPEVDADVRCMAAYLFVVGQMVEDASAKEEDKNGATTVVMYFFGKVRGRLPQVDVKGEIRRLVETPGYIEQTLQPDLERCGREYGQRGKELEAFGD